MTTLTTLTTSVLATVWNKLSDKPVKRFSTKLAGITRLAKNFTDAEVNAALVALGLAKVKKEANAELEPVEKQSADDVIAHKKMNREQWLNKLAIAMIPQFNKLGYKLPRIAISCGFTSHGTRGKAIGECWYPEASSGDITEIFIKPDQVDQIRVADILCHEMIHASFGMGVGHKKPFADAAKKLGLEGKPTATVAGKGFIEWITPLMEKVGEYPHEKLGTPDRKVQKSDPIVNLRCLCDADYFMKVPTRCLNLGRPTCPCCGEEMTTKEERDAA